MRPFARLRSAKGRVYSKAADFLTCIAEDEQRQRETVKGEQSPRRQRRTDHVKVKPLKEFHDDTTYAGDLHRADMAWAKHAAGRRLTPEQIRDELFNGRDLSKKGSRKRQLECANRTANKAIEEIRRR
jgi:hypothetical protein